MKSICRHSLLALAAILVGLVPSISAEEMRYSDFEKRLSPASPTSWTTSDATPVTLLSYGQSTEYHPPLELGGSSNTSTSMSTEADGESCNCGDSDCNRCCAEPLSAVYYADVQLFFMRTHILETAIGKLSEKYELSPRFILGFEGPGGVGGRARYWTYGRWTPNLDGGAIRVDMDVIDFETTCRFRTSRTDLVIAGGIRWTDMDIALGASEVENEMPGATVAADLRTAMHRDGCREWAAIGGARWSLLGGDWEGDSGGFVNPVRDDNVVVQELYGGVEYFRTCPNYDLFARLIFEIQNWHSDAAAQDAGADSIGFVGPGLEIGMMF
jgi:hypothetical protein